MIREELELRNCNNKCHMYKTVPKCSVYQLGGCYCRVCDYYFQERISRCPCCKIATRHRSRSNRRLTDQPSRVA